jgi:hypothetical protein
LSSSPERRKSQNSWMPSMKPPYLGDAHPERITLIIA